MKLKSNRGNLLLMVLVFASFLAVTAISVLDLSMGTYRLSMRNEIRAEARAVAESELEYMLYQFKEAVVSQAATQAQYAPAVLSAICDNAAVPTTVRQPFLQAHANAGWTVMRSMVLENQPFTGTIPTTTKIGTFTYISARVEVIPPPANPFAGASNITVRTGRRFINSNTSLFQYSIFFQGDLELNPGSGNTIINGDVEANGSIYMGPRSGASLQLNGKVRYLQGDYFNTDSSGNTTYINPNAPQPPVGVTLIAPIDASGNTLAAGSSQLEQNTSPENLLGGIDPTAEAQNRPDLFGPAGLTTPAQWTAAQLAQAENNVYRSLIVPPPSASTNNEYPNATITSPPTPDDDVISVRRAYSRADLQINVATDGTITVTQIVNGLSTDVTATFASAITAPTPVYDERENKTISMTKIDVGVLKTTLGNLRSSNGTNHFDFQGLLYVNLKSSSSATPAAVKLVNATSIPFNASTGAGFSVATNGGMYVQGSYNTSPLTDSTGTVVNGSDGLPRAVPSMLMADAITVLSTNWADNTANTPLSSRVASLSVAEGSAMTVNAGLLTGNIPSTSGASSGGAQNLIRYLEDWSGKTVNFKGSIGRLFSSTQFVAPYTGPGSVYMQPNRSFSFDTNIPTHPPPGNPTTTAFGRGDFFTW